MKIGLIIVQIIAKSQHPNFGVVAVVPIVVLRLACVCATVVKFSVPMEKKKLSALVVMKPYISMMKLMTLISTLVAQGVKDERNRTIRKI